jgi:hypothetical protein
MPLSELRSLAISLWAISGVELKKSSKANPQKRIMYAVAAKINMICKYAVSIEQRQHAQNLVLNL